MLPFAAAFAPLGEKKKEKGRGAQSFPEKTREGSWIQHVRVSFLGPMNLIQGSPWPYCKMDKG